MIHNEKIIASLVLPLDLRTRQIVLAKKTKKIGVNRRNGPGGRKETFDTSIEACALRETYEELGIVGTEVDLEKVGIGLFFNDKKDGTVFCVEVHFFILKKWRGVPRSSNELKNPRRYSISRLPKRQMMPADGIVIPRMLTGELLVFEAGYTYRQKKLKYLKIQKVDKL